MSKAFRLMLWPTAQIAAVLLAFAAITLGGLAVIPSRNNLFTMYYYMFPMLGVIIGSMSTASLRPYFNLALSMNGKRPHLFGVQQICLVLLALFAPLLTKAMWLAGSALYEPLDLSLSMFALLTAVSLLLGELMGLVMGLKGKFRFVLYFISILIMVVFCGGLGAYTATTVAREESAAWIPVIPEQWLAMGALALFAVSAVLAFLTWRSMRKAVVEV